MREKHEEAIKSPENDSPTRILAVRDTRDEAYRLEWWAADYGWSFWLYNRSGFKVGYAHLQLRKDALFLADLHIHDEVPANRSGPRMFIESIGLVRQRKVSYRNRGLAKRILEHSEAFAIEHGYREITGGIVKADIARWPDLPDWYRRRGYLVFGNSPDSRNIGELAIQKTLLAVT
jgi:hypothetical protein